MSEGLITLALAHARMHAVIEHDKYVSLVCVLGVRACVIVSSGTDHVYVWVWVWRGGVYSVYVRA
jgi:hypothetical protein